MLSRITFQSLAFFIALIALTSTARAEDLAIRDTDRIRFLWQGVLVNADTNVSVKVTLAVGDENDATHKLRTQDLATFQTVSADKGKALVFKDKDGKSQKVSDFIQGSDLNTFIRTLSQGMQQPLYRLQVQLIEVKTYKTEQPLAKPVFILFPPLSVPPPSKGYIEKKIMVKGTEAGTSTEVVVQIERKK